MPNLQKHSTLLKSPQNVLPFHKTIGNLHSNEIYTLATDLTGISKT